MISRCLNKKDCEYHNYGGAGITVCTRWLCFENYVYDIMHMENFDKFCQNPTLYAIDKAGNSTVETFTVSNIDKDAPNIFIKVLTEELSGTVKK